MSVLPTVRAGPMRILLSFAFPPLAVLLCGRPLQAALNVLLTLCFWIPGVIHALIIVHGCLYDEQIATTLRRMEKTIAEHRPELRIELRRRRRRFVARRTAVIMVMLLISYVLSSGPAAWLLREHRLPGPLIELITVAYRPLDWLAEHVRWLARLLHWYGRLWTG